MSDIKVTLILDENSLGYLGTNNSLYLCMIGFPFKPICESSSCFEGYFLL